MRKDPDSALEPLWLLLNTKLFSHIRSQSRKLGRLTHEDLEDIASEKALDLMRRIDTGKWRPDTASTGEIVNYVSRVARNGVVDALRRHGNATARELPMDPDETGRMPDLALVPPDAGVDSKDYALALRDCAAGLKDVHRLVWMFRAFFGLSTQEIARHPEVQLSAGNVDVVLSRTRARLRDCMTRKGWETHRMPAGSFVEIWSTFRLRRKPGETPHE